MTASTISLLSQYHNITSESTLSYSFSKIRNEMQNLFLLLSAKTSRSIRPASQGAVSSTYGSGPPLSLPPDLPDSHRLLPGSPLLLCGSAPSAPFLLLLPLLFLHRLTCSLFALVNSPPVLYCSRVCSQA